MTLICDILKAFIPFGWGIFCFIGTIVYLAVPDTPRWVAASAWFISMIISFGFVIHIWNYHRSSRPANYHVLPEANQRNVSIKLIVAVFVCVVTCIVSIIFWLSKKQEQYADACAYTVSWIISAVWLCDLWKYHRNPNAMIKFDNENQDNPSNNIENPNALEIDEINADHQKTDEINADLDSLC
eukprot:UN09624